MKLDRRSVVLSFASLAGAGIFGAWPGKAQSKLRTTTQVVDISHGPFLDPNACTKEIEGFYRNLAKHGVKTVIRYYSGYTPGIPVNNFRCKNVTLLEREIIHKHGLSLAIVYQLNGRAAGRYTRETGLRDAEFCLDRAKAIDQPPHSAIYFGIDADMKRHPVDKVEAYFKALSEVIKGRYDLGCYGAGAHSARVVPKYAKYSWIAEAQAWAGTRKYITDNKWTFYQNKTEVDFSGWTKPFKMQIDTNIVNPKANTIGAFNGDGTLATYDTAESELILSRRMWVKPVQLDVYDKPRGRIVGRVCSAKLLHVLSIDDGWASLDINEDGEEEGYCKAELLLPFSQMPQYRAGCEKVDI